MDNGGIINSSIFKVINSEIRLKLLQIILNHDLGLKFIEISKISNISPTVLQHHLKIMVSSGIISHENLLYTSNINSNIYFNLISNYNDRVGSGKHEFFRNHKFPSILNPYFIEIKDLEFEIIPDLFSFFTNMSDYFTGDYSVLKIAGTMNLNLEAQGMKFLEQANMSDFNNKKIEIIFSKKTFEDLETFENKEIFWEGINPELLEPFIIDELNLMLAIFDNVGFLFLPNLENQVEYANICIFSSKKGIGWLNTIWEHIKSKSNKISLYHLKEVL